MTARAPAQNLARAPALGYRRAHAQLFVEGFDHNRKRTQRIWREQGLRVPKKARKRRRFGETTAAADRLKRRAPQRLGARLPARRDHRRPRAKISQHRRRVHPRGAGIECDRTIDADKTVAILKRLVTERGTAPENLRADNGPELTARALAEWCESALTDIAYIDPGAPWQMALVS